MKTLIALIFSCATIGWGGEILRKSDILRPEDLHMFKWEFIQKTDSETGAVMRVERKIGKTVVEKFDVVIFDKDKENLGTLLVFSGETPTRVRLPDGNEVGPMHARRLGNVSYGSEVIAGVDGIERNASFVNLAEDHESIRISFFAAPFSSYRKVLKEMPSTTDGKLSGFRYTHEMVKVDEFVISTRVVDGKKVVSASQIPQATDAGQADPKPNKD